MPVTRILVVLFVSLPLRAAADKPAEQSPELKVLSPMAGKWKSAIYYNPNASDHFTETRTARWILDGHFLLETILTHETNHNARLLYGYDKSRMVYRKWSFDNRGKTSDWSGTWDAEKKTMTWKPTDGTFDAVVTDRFVSNDQHHVTIVAKDKNGKLLMDVEADLRRVKK